MEMDYWISDIVVLICEFLDVGSKLKFISTCRTIRSNINLVRFNMQVDYYKIKNLSFFNSFTNVIVKDLTIKKNLRLPQYIKHLTYENIRGKFLHLPIPNNLISLCWLTKQKINISKIPDTLEMIHIKFQNEHANTIFKNIKNVKCLIIDSYNNVNFKLEYPSNVKSLVWNIKRDFEINSNWQLDYLCLNKVGKVKTKLINAKTIEFGDVDIWIKYNNEAERKLKTLILNGNNFNFYDKHDNMLFTEEVYNELPEHAENCSIKEIIFGKNFIRNITNIIPPSVTKCTIYEGYKGTFPPTVKEIVVLPRN
ncbi:putative F-box and FNIP repeat-containing protein [Tupanvirus soda lake]|uniref:F-box and FNIP repeat-containing protein n=2 Tax=Tupanvirus TaxID=2094720 RepID=A0AC62AAG8_9VIRU|nr:putative F-box and FNIP repeat-containing protein [Tupanvirus soda lake]QKU34765.1 putative F-box and FNIP repeat-containing protein [Tupanvirus soda lake]